MRRFQLFNAQVSGVLNAAMAFLPRFHSETPYQPAISASPASDLYAKICELPRIRQAMLKEGLSDDHLHYIKIKHLETFLTNDSVYQAYELGYFTFEDVLHYPQVVLQFFETFPHACEILKTVEFKIDLFNGEGGFSFRFFYNLFNEYSDKENIADFFNPGFMQFLQTKKIIIGKGKYHWQRFEYGQEGRENKIKLIELSKLFNHADLESLINGGFISVDRILELKSDDLIDLRKLLDCRNLHLWIDEKYLTSEQFLQCSPDDRKQYMRFMERAGTPCEYFTLPYFLSFKPSTRKHYPFWSRYSRESGVSTMEKFDALSEKLQEFFYKMGWDHCRWLMEAKYATFEELCNLSDFDKEELNSLLLSLAAEDHGMQQYHVDRIESFLNVTESKQSQLETPRFYTAKKVELQITQRIDFATIDTRIRQNPKQHQNTYPQTVTVYIPEEFLEEITAKLKNHAHIRMTLWNGIKSFITEMTVSGKELKKDVMPEPKGPKM